MTFGDHLKKGVEKARAALVANNRVDVVLNQFSAKVGLPHQKGRRDDRAGAPPIAPHRHLTPSWSTETDEFILGAGMDRKLVCLVTRSVDGFPVELVYADQGAGCRTEEDRREARGAMLENAKIEALLVPTEVAAAG